MESKYGRSTLAKVELDIPKLKEFKDQLQEMADHFKKEAEDVDIMIVTLEKRVTVLREEDRLDNDRRQRDEKEARPQGTPFRGSGGQATQYPSGSGTGSVPPGQAASAKPTEPTTGTGSVTPTTPPPPPANQENPNAEAQPGSSQAQPVDMEHSSGNDPTTEEESPRNKG
jgi:hypothetical protein